VVPTVGTSPCGLSRANQALRLSPFDPQGIEAVTGLALAHLVARRFEAAIEWADRASYDKPRYTTPIRVKIAATRHCPSRPP